MPVKNIRPLTEQEKLFVDLYIKRLNVTGAYHEAFPGCTKVTAQKNGYALIRRPDVAKYIEDRFAELSKDRGVSIQKVLDGLVNVAYLDVRKLVDDESGELLPLNELPEEVATAIGGVKVTERWVGSGEDATKIVSHEYKLIDRNPALTNLGRYLKMFVDVQQHDVRFGLGERMKRAKEKARAVRKQLEEARANG